MAGIMQQPNMLMLMYTCHVPQTQQGTFNLSCIHYIFRGLLLELLLEKMYKHPKKPANQFLE